MEKTRTRIGTVPLENPLVLGPMSGITDLAFRLVAKSFGAGLVYIPLISAKAICLGSRKTFELLVSDPRERPVALQLFGAEPDTVANAVKLVDSQPVDFIDINMGCPVPKVAGHAGGAALMRDIGLASEIVAAAVGATTKPVLVKMRSGWDENSVNAVELSRAAERLGVSALAIHPRTKSQGFSGPANWSLIAEIKNSVSIPVIGNGDVWSPEDARKMLEQTGCDLVMIARAARGNPWIFSRTLTLLREDIVLPEPSPRQRLNTLLGHCTLLAEHMGGRRAVLKMRKHAGWYVKGLRNAASLREKINHAQSIAELVSIVISPEGEWHESCTP